MPIKLAIDDEFCYYDVPFIVHSINPPNITIQRLDGDKKTRDMDYILLISDINFVVSEKIKKKVIRYERAKELKLISRFDSLSENQKEKVLEKYQIIKPVLLLERAKFGDLASSVLFLENYSKYIPEKNLLNKLTQNKLIELLADDFSISVRTIKRYLADYKKTEIESPTNGKDGLISKKHLENPLRKDEIQVEITHPLKKEVVLDVIKVRLDQKYLPIIKGAIEKEYLQKKKVSIAYLTEIIEIECFKKNIKPLGYNTVYHIISRMSKQVVNILRIGDAALEEQQLIERGFYKNAKTPLHIIEIDHTQLDMDVIDENTGINIGRPWITVGIDVYSREIWCIDIDTEPPSANKVRKAIKHGLFTKKVKEKYNTINEWDICGIPTIIYVDNGSDFTSADVKQFLAEGLNIDLMHRPVKIPKYGAIIERVIGTINRGFIHNLAGNRKSNPKELGEYNAEKEAIFTLEDIREIITTWIVDIYHHREHKNLPLQYPTPAAMFYHGLDMFGYPDIIQEDEKEIYELKLMAQTKRKYSRDGIRLDNVIYNSKESAKYLTAPYSWYRIKFDLDDISFIYLLDDNSGEYVRVEAQNPPYSEIKGMNRRTFNLIRKELKRIGNVKKQQIIGSRDISKGKRLLNDKINNKIKNNKRMRQEALRSGFSFTSSIKKVEKSNKEYINNKTMELLEKVNQEKYKKDGKYEQR
ncbi:DDE-type integrase/transposase/recombinase [Bacillus sp. JRC01]|nr:DDE-type integrase/transposase/recombinase [Bacillus sp. JRC01]